MQNHPKNSADKKFKKNLQKTLDNPVSLCYNTKRSTEHARVAESADAHV